MGNFSEIKTRNDFADFLRIPRNKLTHILYVKKPDSYYKTFEIPKKNGDKRKICAPSGDLKSLQVKLANALWEHQKSIWTLAGTKPNISHAFEKGKSIVTNAKVHRNKRFILNMDPTLQAQLWDRIRNTKFEERYAKQDLELADALRLLDYAV